ncbi:MAG: hypothetical protein ACFFCV_20020 [Promethearchaeota archaeon]
MKKIMDYVNDDSNLEKAIKSTFGYKQMELIQAKYKFWKTFFNTIPIINKNSNSYYEKKEKEINEMMKDYINSFYSDLMINYDRSE